MFYRYRKLQIRRHLRKLTVLFTAPWALGSACGVARVCRLSLVVMLVWSGRAVAGMPSVMVHIHNTVQYNYYVVLLFNIA